MQEAEADDLSAITDFSLLFFFVLYIHTNTSDKNPFLWLPTEVEVEVEIVTKEVRYIFRLISAFWWANYTIK